MNAPVTLREAGRVIDLRALLGAAGFAIVTVLPVIWGLLVMGPAA